MMSNHASSLFVVTQMRVTLLAVAIAVVSAASTDAWPQQVQTTPAQQAAPPAAATPAEPPSPPAAEPSAPSNPGLVEEIGRLFKDSVSGLKDSASGLTSKIPSARETLDGINSGAKTATDSLTRINPIVVQSMVSGRAVCPAAANGAPDCKAASDHLCKTKGYKEGKSLDIESSEKCSARVYLSGRTGTPGECRTENFVTRAVCQ